FCSVILNYLREIVRDIYKDSYLEERIVDLKFQIDYGIELFGIVHHPQYGKMYAYETDGYGNHVLMDDANVPSLLSIPYLGFTDYQDEVYQNTRQFVLSHENPYYYEGTRAKGIGSPHTWPQYIWPIALSMQGLTSQNENEMKELIDMIMNNTGGTGVCHESFDVNDDSKYTRPWFCWANSLFAELVLKAYFKM
ncbi:glycoside hydrolase family 125 protein, partial [Coprobacillus cateniformis]|nr:glycoside hydrolase family 125 protein [Coprobacillus cateniformis]